MQSIEPLQTHLGSLEHQIRTIKRNNQIIITIPYIYIDIYPVISRKSNFLNVTKIKLKVRKQPISQLFINRNFGVSGDGKNLRFFKKVFRFLGFNVYAQSHAEHWTQEYDQLKSYSRKLTDALLC